MVKTIVRVLLTALHNCRCSILLRGHAPTWGLISVKNPARSSKSVFDYWTQSLLLFCVYRKINLLRSKLTQIVTVATQNVKEKSQQTIGGRCIWCMNKIPCRIVHGGASNIQESVTWFAPSYMFQLCMNLYYFAAHSFKCYLLSFGV